MATKKVTQLTDDEQLQDLFDKVAAEKKAVNNAEKPCWLTSGSFGYSTESAHQRINIQTETNIKKLVDILSFLMGRKKDHAEATAELGVKTAFTWLGYKFNEWSNDLKTRVDQLQIQTKKTKLNEMEQRLNAVLSPELKRKMELAAISKLLKGVPEEEEELA